MSASPAALLNPDMTSATRAAHRAFTETATLCKQKLEADDILQDPKKLSWLCRMLLTTAEEALRTNYAFSKASESAVKNRIMESLKACRDLENDAKIANDQAQVERERFCDQVEQNRKLTVENFQLRHKSSEQAQELKLKYDKVIAEKKKAEAAWAEERRTLAAIAGQRERNLSLAVVKMQEEIDSLKAVPGVNTQALPRLASMDSTAMNGDVASGGRRDSLSGRRDSVSERELEDAEEIASLRRKCDELERKVAHGAQLIMRLKQQLRRQHAANALRESPAHSPLRSPSKSPFRKKLPGWIAPPPSMTENAPEPAPSTRSETDMDRDHANKLSLSASALGAKLSRSRVETNLLRRELELSEKDAETVNTALYKRALLAEEAACNIGKQLLLSAARAQLRTNAADTTPAADSSLQHSQTEAKRSIDHETTPTESKTIIASPACTLLDLRAERIRRKSPDISPRDDSGPSPFDRPSTPNKTSPRSLPLSERGRPNESAPNSLPTDERVREIPQVPRGVIREASVQSPQPPVPSSVHRPSLLETLREERLKLERERERRRF